MSEEKKPLLSNGLEESYDSASSILSRKSQLSFKSNSSDEDAKKKKRVHGIRALFRYATAQDKLLIFIGSLASIVHGAGFPLLSIVFGGMTNTFLRAEVTDFKHPGNLKVPAGAAGTEANLSYSSSNSSSSFLTPIPLDEFNSNVIQFALYYSYVGFGMLIASYIQIACWVSACERQVLRLRHAFFRSTLRQEIAWFDKHQSGQLTSRLNDDLERVREGIGDKFSLFIQFTAAFLSGFVIGFIYNWQLTLVMMSLTPLLAASGAWMGFVLGNIQKQEQEKYAVAGAVAEEVLGCIRTVLSLNGTKREVQRYDEALETGRKLGIRKYIYVGTGLFCTFFTLFASYALAFWYGSVLILNDPTFPRGTVFTVFFAVMAGSFSLGNAVPHFNNISSALGAASGLYDIIDNEPTIDPYSELGQRPEKVEGRVTFHKVGFSYPSRKQVKVLKNVSFTVEPGQKVAFVGASGCGKSTIVNLLLRYYDPQHGKVSIDGYDLKNLNVRYLRNLVGVVSQEPVLFDGTLEDNIKLGRPGISHEEIVEATKLANAHNFIVKLPLGLGTRVGERGVQLSGGQKQRIAIARALVRNPKILLLDEATSALDAESETIVQKALDQAQEGRTTVSIAHRLSTIADADQIFVVQSGDIIEHGTHMELMHQKGQFYRMVMAQQLDSADPAEKGNADGTHSSEAKDETDPDIPGVEIEPEESPVRSRKRSRLGTRRSSVASSVVSVSESRRESAVISRLEREAKEEGAETVSVGDILRMNRKAWKYIFFGLCGSVLQGCIMPAFALFYSQIFNVYTEEGEQLKQDALFWSMMFLLLGFGQGIGFFICINFYGMSGENITKTVRLGAFANLIRHDIGYFDDEKHATGKICTRLATDAPNLRAAVGNRLASVVSACFSLVAGLVIAFVFGWKLALVITAMLPVIIASGYVEFWLQWQHQHRDAKMLEEAGRTSSEAIENVRTVQALTREVHFFDQYTFNLAAPFKEAMKQAHVYGLGFGFSQSVMFFMYAAAFRYGAYLIQLDEITSLNVFRVFFAINFTGISIGQASAFVPDVVKARLSAALLFKMIKHQPAIDSCSEHGLRPTLSGSIALKDVRFSYPARSSVKVLQGITVGVEPGQTLALVGPSGCGKSTIVALLERFYDPSHGRISIDGYDLRTLHLTSVREQMALVSQEPVLFDCSIRDNILYGLEGKVGHDKVVEAAKLANIHSFILSLPKGYDTPVGEKGTQLSGGQKQRVAIARAMVREPKILLLDEATSALDTESEKVVQEALDRAREGRTCIVIAHRLSTIQSADIIAVMKDGNIVEKGSHSELLELKGLYHSLCQKQHLMEE